MKSGFGMWKKLSETSDLIIYEKKKRSFKIRIEARLNKNSWKIYKTYFNDRIVDFVEEYSTETRNEALNIVNTLVREKDLTTKEIRELKKISGKKLDINLERAYKEYDVEKWLFSVGNDKKISFMTIRFGETIDVDVVMQEKYRFLERNIINELIRMLGLDKFDLTLNQNIYFFNRRSHSRSKFKNKSLVIGKIEMDFGGIDET